MQSEIVDIVKQLGGPPAGVGKKRFEPMLPWNEAWQVEYVERTLHLPRLPAAWDGLTILHLSDLHLCGTPDRSWFRAVMDRCAAWEPDLVAVTGDLADGLDYLRWIVPVLGRLRCKIAAFAILGNHDDWYAPDKVRRRLRRIGMHVLGNGWEQIEVRGEPLVVIGQEGPWFPPPPDLSACPTGAVPSLPEPHAGQHPLGATGRRRSDAVGPRPRRSDSSAAVRLDAGAEPLRPPLRLRRLRRGADVVARQPRPGRRSSVALPVPAGGDAADSATAVGLIGCRSDCQPHHAHNASKMKVSNGGEWKIGLPLVTR